MSNKEEAIEGLKKVWDAFDHMEHELYADYVFDALEMLMQLRRGHWIENDGTYKCSECGEISCCRGNYCPDCGTKMDEVTP